MEIGGRSVKINEFLGKKVRKSDEKAGKIDEKGCLRRCLKGQSMHPERRKKSPEARSSS